MAFPWHKFPLGWIVSAMILKVLFFEVEQPKPKKFLINPFFAAPCLQDKVSQALLVWLSEIYSTGFS